MAKKKRDSSLYYGKKKNKKKYSHQIKMKNKSSGDSYDKLYKEQLSLLSRIFHK